MQSPPIEWALGIGYLATIDYLRARGEADNDTLSECVRSLVERHPHGRVIFTAALVVGAEALRRHILTPT